MSKDRVAMAVADALDNVGRLIAGEKGGRVAAKVSDALVGLHPEWTKEPCTGEGCQLCAEEQAAR